MQHFSKFIGIDVSKDKIDVFFKETSHFCTLPNKAASIRKAFGKVDRCDTLVALESTGGYEKICVKTLSEMNFNIHRANNNKFKSFKKSEGVEDKTDKIDAKCLADYGKEKHIKPKFLIYEASSELQNEIKQLTFRLTSFKEMMVSEKNRLQSPGCDMVAESCKETIDFLGKQIAIFEKRLIETIKSDPESLKKFELLRSYKGIGNLSAAYLVSHLPELGKIKPKAIFELAGLAPKATDSGNSFGYRTTRGRGRPFVKRTLFMVALSAIRYNENISVFYEKKIAEKKRKMVALVACMRKILSQLNAILKNGENNF
ncbi:MAG: IS110 family transposase [Holosporaceae bacterium]|jgi:transposase|nr:IS110 family transposase [Holosporaceae bacterium]